MAIIERRYTAEELLTLSAAPDYDNQRLELSDGELIVMAPASMKHGIIAQKKIKQYLHAAHQHPIRLDRPLGSPYAHHGYAQ
jgi:Uma2 family endonuclease